MHGLHKRLLFASPIRVTVHSFISCCTSPNLLHASLCSVKPAPLLCSHPTGECIPTPMIPLFHSSFYSSASWAWTYALIPDIVLTLFSCGDNS